MPMFPAGEVPEYNLMAFLHGYFDESGKHASAKVVSFCGFVDLDWIPFHKEWTRLLRAYKLSGLHISKDKLKATTTQLKMYREFIRAIRYTVSRGLACAVDVPAFNTMHKAVRSELGDDPHYLAFSTVMMDIVKYATVVKNTQLAITCDDDQQKACDIYRFYRRAKQRNLDSSKILRL